jgi:hypothetical protein
MYHTKFEDMLYWLKKVHKNVYVDKKLCSLRANVHFLSMSCKQVPRASERFRRHYFGQSS